MPQVQFGVSSVLEPFKPDEGSNAIEIKKRPDLGRQVVTFSFPPMVTLEGGKLDETGWTFQKYLGFVTAEMPNRTDTKPEWVESDDSSLQSVLASQYGCPEGRPKTWTVG